MNYPEVKPVKTIEDVAQHPGFSKSAKNLSSKRNEKKVKNGKTLDIKLSLVSRKTSAPPLKESMQVSIKNLVFPETNGRAEN